MWQSGMVIRSGSIALLIAGMLASSFEAHAAGRVTGTVRDASTGEPLPGAGVLVVGTSIGAATDEEGRFAINSAPSGAQQVMASYLGYEQRTLDVDVPEGGFVHLEFELVWAGVRGQEVVITAQASGQVAAINQQLQSNTITNIVSRDRIQELPDVNAAESIGRLPGISIHRSGGEANRIAIRGLSPKYNTVTVNGVRVPATGADDRSIDLSLISSNMLDGIEVRKALTPDMDADAIAGSVDLRLRDAPVGPMVDILAQGGHNALQDYYGNYKFSGSASNRFFSNQLGVIGTFNVDRYDRSADVFNAGYDQASEGSEVLITTLDLREQNVDRGRVGGSVLADYRIPQGKIAANAFYNRLSNEALVRVNQLFNAGNGRHFYNMQETQNTTSILTAALSAEQDFGRLRYDVGMSRTSSNSESPRDYLFTFAQEGDAYRPFTREMGMDPRQVVQFITPDSTITGLSDVNFRWLSREETNTTFQLNVASPFRFGSHVTGYVKTGGKFRWMDRINDENQRGANGMHYGLSSTTMWLNCVREQLTGFNGYDFYQESLDRGMVPIYVFDDGYTRPEFFGGDYPIGYTADPNLGRMFAETVSECEGAFLERVNDSRGRDYSGEERYQAGYLMSEINIGRRITVIPGIRLERDQSVYEGQQYREAVVNNQQASPTDLQVLVARRENTFWLPSLHVQMRPTEWAQIRLARTESLARPDYIQYVPITRIDSQLRFAFAGNTALRPAHARNLDAALSIYEGRVGLFTVAAFHKRIEDHIRWVRFYATSGDPLPDFLNVPEGWLANTPAVDTYLNNPDPATVRGFEIDWQTNFWYLPSVFKGIVLSANYTRIFSETTYRSFKLEQICTNCPSPRPRFEERRVDIERTGRLGDQPAHIANVTLGYDFRGFSARLSYLYQTDRADNIDVVTPIQDTFTGDYSRWDLSIRQKVRMGFEVFANFNNLTDTKDRAFIASAVGSPTRIEQYGFSVDIGGRYRL